MKEIRIEQIQDRLLTLIVCCNLSPEEMSERKEEVERLLPPSGTTMGWKIILDDGDVPEVSMAPVPCDTIKGNWHYIAMC